MKTTLSLCASLLLLACASVQDSPIPDNGNDAAAVLQQIIDDEWSFRLREYPLLALSQGHDVSAGQPLFPALTPADLARRADFYRQLASRLDAIDRAALPRADQISRDILARLARDSVARHDFGGELMSLTSDWGFHIATAALPSSMPLRSETDYRRYLAMLQQLPGHFDANIALLEAGVDRGMVLPAAILPHYAHTIRSHVVERPEDSVFYSPMMAMPDAVSESAATEIQAQARELVASSVIPAYQRFLDFFEQQYIPAGRDSLGATELPDGDAYYQWLIEHFTTLPLDAETIHQTGLREVARIRAAMQQVMDEVEFTGEFSEFLTFLREDPRFYAETPEQLLKEAAYISKRMDAQLPKLFGHLPRTPYGVAPVPDHLAPNFTGGRYIGTSLGSTQPGYYWVNTYALESRPLYVLEALSLHEAVPGHHLQIALAMEAEGLPAFRRDLYLSAFGEGWGLYSEGLGEEVGFYTDPYSRFGRLTYDMWRACRLVVDTGLHAFGWSKQQAIDYLAGNTALSLHEVGTEVDRYISWPGQALSYKIGELKIRELRREAEQALGADFDVREFHDAVLANGTVPLPVLEQEIRLFIADQLNAAQ